MTNPTPAAVIAIDGGNSKTDVAIVAGDGTVLGRARGPAAAAPTVGMDVALQVLGGLVKQAADQAGLPFDGGKPLATHLAAYLAGVDIPQEEAAMHAELSAQGWTKSVKVDNDTFAIFRAGTSAHWGVGVVAGAGANAVGLGPDGRIVRFPSIGEITGDFGGGGDLSGQTMWFAMRDEDGRGQPTALRQAVMDYFGKKSIYDVAIALHLGELSLGDRLGLTHLLFEVAATGDAVAVNLLDRQAHEVALMAKSTLRQLDLIDTTTDVVLGGGVLTARDPLLMRLIDSWMAYEAPKAVTRINDVPAIAGAALLGLDHVGAAPAAEERLRSALRMA